MSRASLRRGSTAVSLAIAMMVLMMASALFSEYYRIHAMQTKVEAQLIQATNVALEASMHDDARQLHENLLVDKSMARDMLLSYMRYNMGLENYALTDSAGKTIYCLEDISLSIAEEPPHIELKCSLRIPSMFSLFTDDMRVPMDVRSRNGRIEED